MRTKAVYELRPLDAWYKAAIPRRWHRCFAVSAAIVDGHLVERCACGGIRLGHWGWFQRNSRRGATT